MAQLKTLDWVVKLRHSHGLPKVIKVSGKMAGRWGTKLGDTCAIPSPAEVDGLMKKVPKGKLITINELREGVAKKHRATIACPLTTGIFTWIAANAAAQELSQGKKTISQITPYWRILKVNGEVNPKYPGGLAQQKKLLAQEGHQTLAKGKKLLVRDYQKVLTKL